MPASQFTAPYKPAEDPRFSQAPPRGTWGGGRTGRATGGGGDGSSCPWPSPRFSPEKAGSTRRGGGPEGGWGVSAPPPVGRSRSPLSSVALYPGEETGTQGLRSERSEGGDHCKIGAAAVAGETWDGGAWIVVGAEHQKKKIQSQQRQRALRPGWGAECGVSGGEWVRPQLRLSPPNTHTLAAEPHSPPRFCALSQPRLAGRES